MPTSKLWRHFSCFPNGSPIDLKPQLLWVVEKRIEWLGCTLAPHFDSDISSALIGPHSRAIPKKIQQSLIERDSFGPHVISVTDKSQSGSAKDSGLVDLDLFRV